MTAVSDETTEPAGLTAEDAGYHALRLAREHACGETRWTDGERR